MRSAVLAGLLNAVLDEKVNVVNAPAVAALKDMPVPEQRLSALFKLVLARDPTQAETKTFLGGRLGEAPGPWSSDSVKAWTDVLWALTSSAELLRNH